MLNLKLTNLERMSQTEMKNVKGGKYGIGIDHQQAAGADSKCWCIAICTGEDNTHNGRKNSVYAASRGRSAQVHPK